MDAQNECDSSNQSISWRIQFKRSICNFGSQEVKVEFWELTIMEEWDNSEHLRKLEKYRDEEIRLGQVKDGKQTVEVNVELKEPTSGMIERNDSRSRK